MAFNKNSSVFTFTFATIMAVVVGTILAVVSMALKPRQQVNEADKKRTDILKSIGIESTSKESAEVFSRFITKRISFDKNGNIAQEMTGAIDPTNKLDPFNIDVKKDYKNELQKVIKKHKADRAAATSALSQLDLTYPIYKANKNDTILYIIPCAGTGLWGPIWGFIALEEDLETIYGTAFDHKGETPGLGAPIAQSDFQNKFVNKTIDLDGEAAFEVLKAGVPDGPHSIQGITGGTITSRGVGEMIDRTIRLYKPNFDKLKN